MTRTIRSFRVRLRHGAALVAGVLLLAGPVAAPAGAVDEPKPQPATWSIQPATSTGPDTRPNFTLTMAPGQTRVDRVLVSNRSAKPLTLKLYAADAYNTDDADFGLQPSTAKATGIGSWIALKKKSVTVPARSATNVPFSIQVPVNVTPGDHAGGIVAALTTEATAGDAGKVAVEQRVGTRVYVRVLGELDAKLTVTDVKVVYSAGANPASGAATVSYTVRNEGNVRLASRQRIEVQGPFGLGKQTVVPADVIEMLPGESASLSQRVEDVPAAGRITAKVTLAPFIPGSSNAAQPEVSASASTWAIAWWAVGLVVLLVLLGVGVVHLRRRARVRGEAKFAAAVAAASAGSAESSSAKPE